MGNRRKKKVLLERGCGCQCSGCCWPVSYPGTGTGTPVYPCGTLGTIVWEISAPNCPAINGLSGFYVPVDPTAVVPEGICGKCACYQNVSNPILISGELKTPFEVGTPTCDTTPCSLNLYLFLSCDSSELPEPVGTGTGFLDTCCRKLRLLATIDGGATLSGGDPHGTGDVCSDVTPGPGTLADTMIELSPANCVCLETGDGGMTGSFDLSVLGFQCEENWVGGPCDGQPKCCTLFNCSLEGATLDFAPQ